MAEILLSFVKNFLAMKKLLYFLVYSVLLTTFFSCSSGKKALEQGDYYSSTIQAIERLRKNTTHKKSREVLRQSYPLAKKYYLDRIAIQKTSSNPFKNVEIYNSYLKLNHLYDEIMRSPGALRVAPNPSNYTAEARQYRELAAQEYYDAGMHELNLNNRESAKRAYEHFASANQIVTGFKDVNARMNEALDIATLKVVVDQVPVPTVNYQLSVQFFQDQVDKFLFNYDENRYLRFFSPNDQSLQYADQILVVQFDDFTVGNTNNFKATKELTKDSVVVGSVTIREGVERDVYGTVRAEYTEYTKEVVSRGMVSMRILDARTEQVLLHEKFPGEFRWVSKWASFNGDERALTDEKLNYTKLEPVNPPPPQDLFVEFCKPIYSQMTQKIRAYYRNI